MWNPVCDETPAANASYPLLPKPILIPQTSLSSSSPSEASPFSRLYPPILSNYGITVTDFITLIDTINVCLVAPAPFKALEIAGETIELSGEPISSGVGLGLEIVGGVGGAAATWVRVRNTLARSNKQSWGPRGLKMEIVKDGKIRGYLGVAEDVLWERMCLREKPIEESSSHGVRTELLRRRREAMKPFAAQLTNEGVPPLTEHGNVLDRYSAKKQEKERIKEYNKVKKKKAKAEEAAANKKVKAEQKAKKKLRKDGFAEDVDAEPPEFDSDSSVASLEPKISKLGAKREQLMQQTESKLAKAEDEKHFDKIEKRHNEKLKELEKQLETALQRARKSQVKEDVKQEKKALGKEEKAKKMLEKLEWLVIHLL